MWTTFVSSNYQLGILPLQGPGPPLVVLLLLTSLITIEDTLFVIGDQLNVFKLVLVNDLYLSLYSDF